MKLKTKNEVLDMLKLMDSELSLPIKLGLAGSFSRDEQTEDSDIDIVYRLYDTKDNEDMQIDIAICDFLRKNYNDNEYDILCLNYLQREDERKDALFVKLGIGIMEESVYKTLVRDAIWVN